MLWVLESVWCLCTCNCENLLFPCSAWFYKWASTAPKFSLLNYSHVTSSATWVPCTTVSMDKHWNKLRSFWMTVQNSPLSVLRIYGHGLKPHVKLVRDGSRVTYWYQFVIWRTYWMSISTMLNCRSVYINFCLLNMIL